MEIIKTLFEMQKLSLSLVQKNVTRGFVPTMGALHEGHLSLIKGSLKETDITLVSIFVNPTQFAPSEDLSRYPRPIDKDIELLKNLGVDYLFLPNEKEIYSKEFSTYVEVVGLTDRLCGKSRPDHFRGVTTICSKLFHLVMPTVSYFGQKDYQQALVIRRMVNDLNMPLEIKVLPIVRDFDGLALSSRNQYLSKDEREVAPTLYHSLQKVESMIQQGEMDVDTLKSFITTFLTKSLLISIDYISISHSKSLEELTSLENEKEIIIALAVYIGKTRLIDNKIVSLTH